MRIFYAAGASPNAYHISASQLWNKNLYDSLVLMGHEVVPFSKDVTWHFTQYPNFETSAEERHLFLEYKQRLQSDLIDEISRANAQRPIDLFFSYFWSDVCDPETVEAIKSLGIVTVNWYCNGSYQFDLVAPLAPHYDWCLVPERFRLKDYEAVGARPIYCQEAANPNVYKPYPVAQDIDVGFVGQAYGDRPDYIRYLLNEDIDVRVFGYGWDRYTAPADMQDERPAEGVSRARATLYLMRQSLRRGDWQGLASLMKSGAPKPGNAEGKQSDEGLLPRSKIGGVLSDAEMIRLYSRAKINLGFSTCGNTHETGERILQIRLRDFEVPMAGGFYMVEYMEELEEFFDIGKEIVCYVGPEDLADKIKYYLAHDDERESIRKAGHERSLRDHTWQKRFQTSFQQMGLAPGK
jgi:spore maturation protein CgeB